MAIQIGKYKRNGIFIEEIDKSVFTTPVSEGITNLVIGVSKKGPINTPIRLTSVGDLEAVFGQLDRNLERKGSFFHRTVAKMLESSPVYAMNLLATDDTLDKIEYKSLSTSVVTDNNVIKEGPYRRFFDTTGFWKKDTESFINLTKGDLGYNDRLLNITNLSDRNISVFIVKSQVAGFDRTLLEWYGAADKMPEYVKTTDFASDYLVDVVVVGGDWSNYAELAADARWSQYFNTEGLIKDKLRVFANDRNITLLGFYEGLSLIPYFRDLNNRNIFIETVINRETDRTGLYCSFNADLLDNDRTGSPKLIDLLGSSLAGGPTIGLTPSFDAPTNSTIDFLSYKETLVEDVLFYQTPLDLPGNVVALYGSQSYSDQNGIHGFGAFDPIEVLHTLGATVSSNDRTSWFSEGGVYNVGTPSLISTTASITLTYTIGDNAFAVMEDTYVKVSKLDQVFVINGSDFPTLGTTASFTSAIKLSLDGSVSLVNGSVANINPSVLSSDIVLDYVTFNVNNNVISTTPFVVGSDYNISIVSGSKIKVEFIDTNATPSTNRYEQYRKIKTFNKIISIIETSFKDRATLIIDANGTKRSLSTMTIGNVVTSTSQNKSFELDLNIGDNVALGLQHATYLSNTGSFVLYKTDNEFILGKEGAITKDGLAYDSDDIGVAAKYSNFYTSFINGNINTGDTFEGIEKDNTSVTTIDLELLTTPTGDLEVRFGNDQNAQILDSVDLSSILVTSQKGNFKQSLEIEGFLGYVPVDNKVLVNGSRYSEVRVGDFLEAVDGGFTRILTKRQFNGDTSLTEITCDSPIKKVLVNGDSQAMRYTSIDKYVSTYKAITLKGFKIRQASLPDGTESRQNQILNLVAKGTPLFKALINKEAFDFRYLVDAFGLGLAERSKQQLVDICGERLNVFGFINMPSLKSFKNSSSPSFVNTEGVLQAEFIAQGGDPESNPAFLYSFAEGPGVTTVGYFLPYVTVNDNGRPLEFPPASFVASTYMRKFASNVGSITPWTIAAGVTNGKVTGIAGVEQEFDNEDIEFFTQAQMNPIVLKRTRGYIIDTESTALTLYKSSLSSIHSREVLIELERELAAMLLDYQWKFNTPDVRAEIKLRADVICETYVNKNGLYDYFNKMDDENNTGEIIDNQIGVLDTYVEIIKGMGIIVNNVTILRTGAIASGGFMPV